MSHKKSSIVFVGDIALPYEGAVKIVDLPKELENKAWLGNLEGPIIEVDESQHTTVLYNSIKAISDLKNRFEFVGFSLANNHITDTGSISSTLEQLNTLGIQGVGAGNDCHEAGKPIIISLGNKKIQFLNFGWEVIQCTPAKSNAPGVNPLTTRNVLSQIQKAIESNPESITICLMHWGYELEAEPQPYERSLARTLIDMGVKGIIGTHAHRVGGIEYYKGAPIVYSLGNWLFKQGFYYNGSLKYPPFCSLQLAFEWDFNTGIHRFHFFEYDPNRSVSKYLFSQEKDGFEIMKLTPFKDMSDKAYENWYKANHYHQNKGLPIYYWGDSNFIRLLKNHVNKVRDIAIYFLRTFLNK